MGTHRRFSPEFKLRMVMEVVTGAKRPSEVCREHKLKDSQLLKWRKQFADNAIQIFERSDRSGETARIAELERSVGRLVGVMAGCGSNALGPGGFPPDELIARLMVKIPDEYDHEAVIQYLEHRYDLSLLRASALEGWYVMTVNGVDEGELPDDLNRTARRISERITDELPFLDAEPVQRVSVGSSGTSR